MDYTAPIAPPAHASSRSAGARLVSAGVRLLSAGARLLSAGARLLSAGARLPCAGARLLFGGARLLSAGPRLRTALALLRSAGVRLVSASVRLVSASALLVFAGALLLEGCAGEAPPTDAYLRAQADLPLGAAVVEVRGAERRLDHVYYWVPNSFADRDGLGAILRQGFDPAPADEERRLSFARHRRYPVHGWSAGEPRMDLTLVAQSDPRSIWTGMLTVRGAGLDCRARVRGTGIGSGAYEGECAEGGRVRLALRPWQVETTFLLPQRNRAHLGDALPDFPALRARCAAGHAGTPWCGPAALERFTSDGGSQRREPGSGTWITSRGGGVLLMVPWSGVEEILLLPSVPEPGTGLMLRGEAFRFAPDLAEGDLRARRPVNVDADFDGTVFLMRTPGGATRRVVPDPLVVTGIFGDVL